MVALSLCFLAASLAVARSVTPVGNYTDVYKSTHWATPRGALSHTTRPVKLLDKALVRGNSSHNEFSSNWAGAAYHDFASGTFKHVSSTIIVPGARLPPGAVGGTTYYSSAWVGIDGYGPCSGAILQTGIDITVSGGSVSYDAWYEWFPEPAFEFSGQLAIRTGDKLRFTVDASSSTTGKAVIENLSTGQSVSQALSSSVALCGTDAEWIVEDFSIGENLAPFANFGSVTFSDANAVGPGGSAIGPQNATLIDIFQGHALTQSSQGQGTVTVKYVG